MLSLEFRLRKIRETKNYRLDEINHTDLMSEKYKKICKYLNYPEHLLILVSTVTGCIWISTFASLVCVPVSIASSAVGIEICTITSRIKKYKSLIKKKKKKHDEIVLLGKAKLTIGILLFKSLINWYTSHDKFVSVNNIVSKYNEMKEEI